MTAKQKIQYKEVNRKTAAAEHLKYKVDEQFAKEKCKKWQQKCRLLKYIPKSPCKFEKLGKSVVKTTEKSPKM